MADRSAEVLSVVCASAWLDQAPELPRRWLGNRRRSIERLRGTSGLSAGGRTPLDGPEPVGQMVAQQGRLSRPAIASEVFGPAAAEEEEHGAESDEGGGQVDRADGWVRLSVRPRAVDGGGSEAEGSGGEEAAAGLLVVVGRRVSYHGLCRAVADQVPRPPPSPPPALGAIRPQLPPPPPPPGTSRPFVL